MIRKTVFDPQLTSECKNLTLREKCPNTGKFSPNTGKYGSEKSPYLDTFHTM